MLTKRLRQLGSVCQHAWIDDKRFRLGQTVRSISSTSVIIRDGFQNAAHCNSFLTGSGAAGAVIDHHEYQCFTNGYVAMSAQEHIGAVCSNARSWGGGQDKYVIVGEWSGAMIDCADALVSLDQ
jgi:glucan 1,3-beta-glucosidase